MGEKIIFCNVLLQSFAKIIFCKVFCFKVLLKLFYALFLVRVYLKVNKAATDSNLMYILHYISKEWPMFFKD